MSRLVATLVPFYEYDEERFFRSDGAPDEVAERAPRRLHAPGGDLPRALRRDGALTAEVEDSDSPTCSSPPPTACRSSTAASCASTWRAGAVRRVVVGRAGDRPRRQRASTTSRAPTASTCSATTSTRSACDRARRARGARPGARRLPPGRRRQRAPPARDLRARRGLVPHVGDRGGHAGGAPRALPHAPLAPGALLRRLPRLVGRRAARRRQPVARRTRRTRSRRWTTTRCACCARASDIACVLVNPLQALHPNAQRAQRLDAARQRPHRRLRPRRRYTRLAREAARRLHASAASC